MPERERVKHIESVRQARRKLLSKRWIYLLGVVGPGMIAANAGNDAGGIATYSSLGAAYGYEMGWLMVVITLALFTVQEQCARMGAVTGKGLSDLIRENFGLRWTAFALLCLLIANFGVIISDFVGIAAALELFRIPRWISVPLFAGVIWWIVVKGSYHKVEKLFIALTVPFLAYVYTAFAAKPDWNAALYHTIVPVIHLKADYLMLLVATVGTTITPYMQLILQSSVVERGVDIKHYRPQWWDVLIGTVFGSLISYFILIVTAATLHPLGVKEIDSAATAASALAPVMGEHSVLLFGIGLFGASMLAVGVLPLATSFSLCEALGWKSGVSYDLSDAREFYAIFTVLLVLGALAALIPGLPLFKVLVMTQILNGLLLPAVLVFCVLLSGNARIMGEHRSKGSSLILGWITTIVVGVLALALIVLSFVLPLFGVKV